jgi:hypothetical protein
MDCVVLIVLGVLFEVAGLGLLAWQLARVQRHELGIGWLASVQSMWRVLKGARFVSRSVTLRAAGGRATARGDIARVGAGRGTTVESRLDALERNQAAMDEEIDARFREQDDLREALEHSIRAMEARVRREEDAREDERLTRLRESVAYQWIGTVLFFTGAVLAGVANGVC